MERLWHNSGSSKFASLATRTEVVLVTFVYSPLNNATRLLAGESFIEQYLELSDVL